MINEAHDPAVGVGDEAAHGGERPAVGDAGQRGEEEAERERVGGERAVGRVESADERGIVVGVNEIAKERSEDESGDGGGGGVEDANGGGGGRGGAVGRERDGVRDSGGQHDNRGVSGTVGADTELGAIAATGLDAARGGKHRLRHMATRVGEELLRLQRRQRQRQ